VKEATRVVKLLLSSYTQTLASGRARYVEPRVTTGIVRSFLTQVEERRTKDLLAEKAEKSKNKIRFLIDNKKFFKLPADEKERLMELLAKWMKQSGKKAYAGYSVVDAVCRVAGTGSIGIKRYAFLIVHLDHPKKALLLDMKESKPSSLAPYVQVQQPSWENEGKRIVSIQQRMVSTPPALLSDIGYMGSYFVLKEMQPMEDKIDFMIIKDRYKDMETVVHEMAMLTASSQLRSSGRQGSDIADALIAFGQDQHWQQGILDYAKQYAGQVRKDYASFITEYKAGKLS
jgi:uncharacterized protein (DUF2252 family)